MVSNWELPVNWKVLLTFIKEENSIKEKPLLDGLWVAKE
jgi:hypothetical protein